MQIEISTDRRIKGHEALAILGADYIALRVAVRLFQRESITIQWR